MIVMKFGGTALADGKRILATAKIIKDYSAQHRLICVVSAMKGMTDRLYAVIDSLKNKQEKKPFSLINEIYQDHLQALNEINSGPEAMVVKRELKNSCDLLSMFARHIQGGQITSARIDYLVAFGERLSCKLTAEALKTLGKKALAIDAADFLATTKEFSKATPILLKTEDKLVDAILNLTKEDFIPVITGFIGFAEDGCTTTLGRGGSDLSAAVIANVINARQLVLWKDVNGLYDQDPKKTRRAKFIAEATYEEAEAVIKRGAKVVYLPALEPVRDKEIPVLIKNFNQPKAEGTKIWRGVVRKICLVHLGVGRVGRELLKQIIKNQDYFRTQFRVKFEFLALLTSQGGVYNSSGFKNINLKTFLKSKSGWSVLQNQSGSCQIESAQEILINLPPKTIIIDTSASEKTAGFLIKALSRGHIVVAANKKPFAGRQNQFEVLYRAGGNRVLHETNVGAGLPIIKTLKNLLATGDRVIEIKGCFSGTLGFIFSKLEQGMNFSQAVKEAYDSGFTEPDPRDDLSGLDVARKALILARIMGLKLELKQVKLEKLYPAKLANLTVKGFLKQIKTLDKNYKTKHEQVGKKRRVLRYVATINYQGCRVGLEAVEKTSDLGGLTGPDNLVSFKTRRYNKNPLIIKGPGAGLEVTAAGVLTDILSVAGGYHE
ncbi:aspartate kinase [Patescibacteria group bacterium]|nr:aspartate kinase [Patescibacteria group bacterium]MBU1931922.1 aspartate kinase [Patescibacteria group bacterium]